MIDQVLVDVDNLRHVLMDVYPSFPRPIGDSRKATANLLSSYATHYRRQVIAFVDGGPGPEGPAVMTRPMVRPIFAPNQGKADDEICDYVFGHASQRHLLVVSSDREVVNLARSMSANTKSSQEFAEILLRITGADKAINAPSINHQHDAPRDEKSGFKRRDFADVNAELLKEAGAIDPYSRDALE